MRLTRRLFGAGLLAGALPAPGGLLAAERIPLAEISDYFNRLRTASGPFTQVSGDGVVATGTIHIHRPGRARFEYHAPDPALVLVGGGKVAIFDPKSNLPPTQYPLRRTPLNLILKRDVDLGGETMVVGHDFDGTETGVVAQDPERPELGTVRVVFAGPPLEFRGWEIANQDGVTTVMLGELERGVTLAPSMFSVQAEMERRGL